VFNEELLTSSADHDPRFRWAACQLDELGKCVNRKMLQKALAGLPPDLDQTYERILAAIDESHSEYALRVLQWVVFSVIPLTIDQVAEVVAIDVKRDIAFDRDEILQDPLEVFNICSSLITINTIYFDHDGYNSIDDGYDSSDDVYDSGDDDKDEIRPAKRQIIELAHYSVKEYLVSDRISAGRAARYSMRDNVCHDTITASCLGYLLQFQEPELEPDILQSFHLAYYSSRYWSDHADKVSERTKETNEAIVRLFRKNEPAYLNWARLWEYHVHQGSRLSLKKEEIPEPLSYAALFGLIDVVKLLIDNGADVNAYIDGIGRSHALYAASFGGHNKIVELLLVEGAIIPVTGKPFDDPLYIASRMGNEAIVKLLLDTGTKDLVTAEIYGQALDEACRHGRDAVVHVLLDRDTEGLITAEDYGEALVEASRHGRNALVKLLLGRDTEGLLTAEDYIASLRIVSCAGREEVLKLLLDRDTEGVITAEDYGQILKMASGRGNEEVAKLLLDKCATVPAMARHYPAALDEALRYDKEAIVQLLLDRGVVTSEQVLQARTSVVSYC
jgi:ankyrin repeat protein